LAEPISRYPNSIHNRLLTALSSADQDRIQPYLEPVPLNVRFVLEAPNKPIEHVYFPESGVASMIAIGNHDRRIEVGLFGREGVSGSTVILGNDRSPHETFMQIAGAGQRIAADDLRRVMRESPSLHQLLLRYVQAFMIQTAHTALSNGRAKIEERLARWLLMSQDRVADELPLTHEFLSLMLGVRRPGVTDTLNALAGRGLIRTTRSLITIVDREGLEESAGGCYGIPEREYQRLIGVGEA
jgi:CRP-like cAMP-binding protein